MALEPTDESAVKDGRRSGYLGVSLRRLVRNRPGSETSGQKADCRSQGQKAGWQTAKAGKEQTGSELGTQAEGKCWRAMRATENRQNWTCHSVLLLFRNNRKCMWRNKQSVETLRLDTQSFSKNFEWYMEKI